MTNRCAALALLASLFIAFDATADDAWPRTVAEASGYQRTSTTAEVHDFLHRLQALGAPLQLEAIGTSTRGHDIVLGIFADPPVASPTEAHRSGRPIVYVQANIHGGEVEGKEAVQILLRQLARDADHILRKRLVLLVVPVYNTDGNDAFGPGERNRGHQAGPPLIGQRTNGMGLDLNRDCMKTESPEMRAVLASIYTRWNPDAVLDLHTTNGTRHGFDLTYSPPLDPNTEPGVLAYTRDELLPQVRAKLHEQGIETFDYGNASRRSSSGDDEPSVRRWSTFGAEPRYVSNYAGTRNRIGVLSEATSFLPFERRVTATLAFVTAVLTKIASDADRVIALTHEADANITRRGIDVAHAPELGVGFELASRGKETVPLEKPSSYPGSPMLPPGELENNELEIFDRFRPKKTARYPGAYLIPAGQREVVTLLRRHGIRVERLIAAWQGTGRRFRVDEIVRAPRAFQGHLNVTLKGEFEDGAVTAEEGDYVVRTAQPLGILAFSLIEPEAVDGVATWNVLERGLRERGHYPIAKLFTPLLAPTVVVR